MSTSSPRKLAITIALLTAVVVIGTGLAFAFLKGVNYYVVLIFLALLIFFAVFLFLFYALNSFILEKIKPIYKTIRSVSFDEKNLKSDLEEKDVMPDVEKDVMQWARVKTKEISQLRQLEKYRREFLGNVSHELKTPIFNIQGYILTLLDGGLEDKNINKHYLERAEKSVNRLISIVNDLESISRLESGELKLNMQRFDIIKLLEDSIEDHDMLRKERKVKVKLVKTYEKSVYVMADKEKIREVVDNLLVNAIKYGKVKGLVGIEVLDMEDNIMIEVSDDGIGISEKDLPR
ncbi:MAG: histidine kinase dimerization/phospho-acceptor domain-containing protein, partial [Bacteroidales bacterium]